MDHEERRQLAAETLGRYAGTREDERLPLVDAISDAFSEEALEALTGGPPPYGAVSEARAARLARITQRFVERLADQGRPARPLTRLEIQALFRVPDTSAAAIDRRMRAMWPDIDNDLLRTEVTAGCQKVSRAGSNKEGYELKVSFQSDAAHRAAEKLLERNGLLGRLDATAPKRMIQLPYKGKDERVIVERIVTDVLGLDLPS